MPPPSLTPPPGPPLNTFGPLFPYIFIGSGPERCRRVFPGRHRQTHQKTTGGLNGTDRSFSNPKSGANGSDFYFLARRIFPRPIIKGHLPGHNMSVLVTTFLFLFHHQNRAQHRLALGSGAAIFPIPNPADCEARPIFFFPFSSSFSFFFYFFTVRFRTVPWSL